MRSLLTLSVLVILPSYAFADDAWASVLNYGGASNFSLGDGSGLESTQGWYESDPGPMASHTMTLNGTGSVAVAHSFSSPGVIKVSASTVSNSVSLDNGGTKAGSAVVDAQGLWLDTLTITQGGLLKFTWDVSGNGSKTGSGWLSADGRFGVQRSDFSTVGIVDVSALADGSPRFQTGPTYSLDNYFYGSFATGDVIILSGRLLVAASAGSDETPGTALMNYGHSAYTVIEDAFGSGASFTSASGYAYGPAPVPEPATFLALGVGAFAVLRRRRSSV